MIDSVKLIWTPADEQWFFSFFVFFLTTLGFMPLSTVPIDFTVPRQFCHTKLCFLFCTRLAELNAAFQRQVRNAPLKKKTFRPKLEELFSCLIQVPRAWMWDRKSGLIKPRFITAGIQRGNENYPANKHWALDCASLSGGHSASPPWWKDATLAYNKVSFFFRSCCRHSIMRCLFNRSLWGLSPNATYSSLFALMGIQQSLRV